MEDSSRLFEIFLEVQSGLPRQGPGSQQSTLKALSYCNKLPKEPSILDVGCGPGMQTLVLAQTLNCKITAIDMTEEYLSQLRESAEAANLSDRISIINMDMNELSFETESFDLIWAEGSAYIMGVENALNDWRSYLKPDGYIAFTELVWLKSNPPGELFEFFQKEYPSMTNVESNLSIIRSSGYEIVGNFTLPDSTWWDDYYTPLETKILQLNKKFKDDSEALNIINTTRLEIEMKRLYPEWYGYEFFIARKVKPY